MVVTICGRYEPNRIERISNEIEIKTLGKRSLQFLGMMPRFTHLSLELVKNIDAEPSAGK
ncbi:MAG: hypothetical protein C0485_03670 [Pirellula sp.]|nr:hypothetical protein [Pirellula sp.]